MPPIPEMSNEKLRQQLAQYGVGVGPITASKRKFYEKKLQKVMSGGDAPQQEPPSSEEEEDEEEEEEEEPMDVDPEDEVQITKPIVVEARRPLPGRQYETTVTHRTQHADTNTNSRICPKDIVTQAEPPEEETITETRKSGLATWIKLFFLLGLVFLVFLVIKNMDPNAENKIPKSIGSDGNN